MVGVQKRKIQWAISLLIVVCFVSFPVHPSQQSCYGELTQAQYGGGSGEPNDPYLIYTAEQMNAIGADANDWDKHFKLMADIDLSAYTETDFNIIGTNYGNPFRGVFDGSVHTISNFGYTSADTDYIGLFGYVRGGAEIKDLGLIDPNVDARTGRYVGSLVGSNGGTITNSYATGIVSASGRDGTAGGLVGYNRGTITNCYAAGSVTGTTDVGGLVGQNGSVLGVVGHTPVDGLGMIYDCYSTASVFATGNSSGGLVGTNYAGEITNCYATGNVEGPDNVGGLVGRNRATTTNCFSTASVTGDNQVGGLVGNNDGEVRVSFWDIETSGQTTSDGGAGKTTAEMQMESTFIDAGWDFVAESVNGTEDIWWILEGQDYPRLWWEKYGGGTGEPNDPYLIYTAEQMNAIGAEPNDWDKHFKLMADIDLSKYSGDAFNIIGECCFGAGWIDDPFLIAHPFTGIFDGNGHIISNLSYTSTNSSYVGLFGFVGTWGKEAVIKDLGLIDPNVDAGTGSYIGSLVGVLRNGTVTNCYVEGGSVVGGDSVGGLVGAYGEEMRGYPDPPFTISNCYSTSSVQGTRRVGGLVGSNYEGRITNSYATGNVSGKRDVGGLVGRNGSTWHWPPTPGTILNCYSTGLVSGEYNVGGLVGLHAAGPVIGCLWDIETSGQLRSACGAGKATTEMKTADTFAGWGGCGNEGIWTIDEGNDYPRLWWESKPGILLEGQLSDFLQGDGTEDAPYLIYTAEQINMIGVFPCERDKNFKLMADVDLNGFTGTEFNIIGIDGANSFTGVFDGNGHTISNFSYISTDRDNAGLFGCVDDPNAEIRDLGLIDPDIDAGTGWDVGSLVGSLRSGTITGCHVDGGSVSGNEIVGGLVGYNWYGAITNCYSVASVTGDERVGGLVGLSSSTYLGSKKAEITNCYSVGSVSGDFRVGGLAGVNSGTITNCYSVASVSGNDVVGGLVGVSSGTITNCYSIGIITGDERVGGLTGRNSGIVSNCFWDVETSGQTTSAGGIYARGIGKTTAEMQIANTFLDAGWDFVDEIENGTEDVWWILEGQDYPRLWWELIPEN